MITKTCTEYIKQEAESIKPNKIIFDAGKNIGIFNKSAIIKRLPHNTQTIQSEFEFKNKS